MIFIFNVLRLGRWFFWGPNLSAAQKGHLDHIGHMRTALQRLRVAVLLMVIAICIGTVGYRIIEHTPWFDSYYMSLVTLSTVGFGEVIQLSHNGRVFTSFLIVFNIGFFAYAVSTVTSIFADGNVHAFFFDFYMMQKVAKLERHTIVCGFGRHATEVCQELSKQKLPFVVIELDPEKIDALRRDTDYLFIKGDATMDDVLQEAGIERATAIVVTLPLDVNNLFIVMSARQINPALKIICRLNAASDENKLRRAGADHVVMPEQIGGFYMATLVNKPDLVEFFTLISNMGTSRVVFEEISVARMKSQFKGCSMAQSELQKIGRIPVLGLKHPNGQYQLNPDPSAILEPDMVIVVLGDNEQIKYFKKNVLKNGLVK